MESRSDPLDRHRRFTPKPEAHRHFVRIILAPVPQLPRAVREMMASNRQKPCSASAPAATARTFPSSVSSETDALQAAVFFRSPGGTTACSMPGGLGFLLSDLFAPFRPSGGAFILVELAVLV